MPERQSGVEGEDRALASLAKLVIEEPKLSDEALYKCDVTYVKGKCPSISLVQVQMLALPIKAQIAIQPNNSPADGRQTTGLIGDGQHIGPYNEQESLKLSCLVSGGRPEPKSVYWRKIDASGRVVNLGGSKVSSSNLIAPQRNPTAANSVEVLLDHVLTSSDLGAKFECHVEHEALEQQPAQVNSQQEDQPAVKQSTASSMDVGDSESAFSAQPFADFQDVISTSNRSINELMLPSRSLDSHVIVDLNGKSVFERSF